MVGGGSADLEDELAPHRLGEGGVAVGGDDEGAGADDEPVGELGLEISGSPPDRVLAISDLPKSSPMSNH